MTILINKKITHEFVTELMNQIQDDQSNALRVVFFNCPGGDVAAGLALMDYCRWKYSNIDTVAFGVVASLAAVMFSGWRAEYDEGGMRCMAKNAVLMFHGIAAENPEDEFSVLAHKQLMDVLRPKVKMGGVVEGLLKADREVCMDAQSAVDWKLADAIL